MNEAGNLIYVFIDVLIFIFVSTPSLTRPSQLPLRPFQMPLRPFQLPLRPFQLPEKLLRLPLRPLADSETLRAASDVLQEFLQTEEILQTASENLFVLAAPKAGEALSSCIRAP